MLIDERKYSGQNLSDCHYVLQKFDMDCRGIKSGSQRSEGDAHTPGPSMPTQSTN